MSRGKAFAITVLFMMAAALPAAPNSPEATVARVQAKSMAASEAERQMFRIVRRGGWAVPGFNRTLVASATRLVDIGGREVQKKKLQLPQEPLTDVEFFYTQNNGDLVVNSVAFVVRDLFSFQVADKVFAYEVRLVPVSVGEGGVRTYAGAMVTLHYFDEDGDGNFETRYGNLRTLHIPVWAIAGV